MYLSHIQEAIFELACEQGDVEISDVYIFSDSIQINYYSNDSLKRFEYKVG